MADFSWTGFERVELGSHGELVHSGLAVDYWPGRKGRSAIKRDLLKADDPASLLAFAQKWGPVLPWEWSSTEEWAAGYRHGKAMHLEPVDALLTWTHDLRELERDASFERNIGKGRVRSLADAEEARKRADLMLLNMTRQMDLRWAPTDGLDPQVVPRNLLQLAALVILEETRGIVTMQCRGFPSPGCRRVVRPRRGDRPGRSPRYCSPQCGARHRARLSHLRKRAVKETPS